MTSSIAAQRTFAWPDSSARAGHEAASHNLVVFSHLRWNFIFQRPQQLMSRLAKCGWRVHFIEEPVPSDGPARLDCHSPLPGVTVVVPHTPIAATGFHDEQISTLEPLLARFLQSRRALGGVAWLYTPMAMPLMMTAQARVVVYDCMDELSAFIDAPRRLRRHEIALMNRADLMFTGGPSLYAAKRGQHGHVHCLPGAVDAEHFAPSSLSAASAAGQRAMALQIALPHPRLGFYGVIDERVDLDLVAHLADARPGWQIVMVGPVVNVDTQRLPRRPNLHWMGAQDYDTLPHLIAGWDLCLMPFAISECTRFISPNETLEYMAGGKPVISTPVHDVVQLYSGLVAVAPAGDAFVKACQALLEEPAPLRQQRAEAMLNAVFSRSWDHTVRAVHHLLEASCLRLSEGRVESTGQPTRWVASRAVNPLPVHRSA